MSDTESQTDAEKKEEASNADSLGRPPSTADSVVAETQGENDGNAAPAWKTRRRPENRSPAEPEDESPKSAEEYPPVSSFASLFIQMIKLRIPGASAEILG